MWQQFQHIQRDHHDDFIKFSKVIELYSRGSGLRGCWLTSCCLSFSCTVLSNAWILLCTVCGSVVWGIEQFFSKFPHVSSCQTEAMLDVVCKNKLRPRDPDQAARSPEIGKCRYNFRQIHHSPAAVQYLCFQKKIVQRSRYQTFL